MAEAERALQWLWGPGNEEQVSESIYTDGVMNYKKFAVALTIT